MDEERWETRKIEFYPDGHIGYADEQGEHGRTILADQSVPPREQVAQDTDFRYSEISRDEFEAMWEMRLAAK